MHRAARPLRADLLQPQLLQPQLHIVGYDMADVCRKYIGRASRLQLAHQSASVGSRRLVALMTSFNAHDFFQFQKVLRRDSLSAAERQTRETLKGLDFLRDLPQLACSRSANLAVSRIHNIS